MKYGIFILLAMFIDPGKIGKVNSAKSEARTAFERGEYKQAIAHYKTLTDSLGVKEDEVTMNLAHSYFNINDTLNAQNTYQSLTASPQSKFRSVANQQLGVLANRQGKFEEALDYFKNALKADPTNEEARFNYEMVKKKLEEQKKQEEKQQQQNKDQKKDDQKKEDQNKDQKDKENKDNKDQKEKKDQEKKDKADKDKKDKAQQDKDKQQKEEQQKKEQEEKDKNKNETPPSVSEKLKEMKMSEDKARMVLEAMKNQEVQYLQQNKRKATKPRSKGKPDW